MLALLALVAVPMSLAESPPEDPEVVVVSADDDEVAAPKVRGGNSLSKRTQLRYEDVLITRDGSRWRGKIVQRGELWLIRLQDGSEVAVEAASVASVSREMVPGNPHTGQWAVRGGIGGEVAFVAGADNPGVQWGPVIEAAITHNFKGPFEPELIVILNPLGPQDGAYQWQIGLGTRYYLVPNRKVKPFNYTELVVYGQYRDLGIRTGPGFLWDPTPNIGIGVSQGVTIMSQKVPDSEGGDSTRVGVGFHVLLHGQLRF